ncbi:MAG: hypothetical protein AAFW68_04835, partial [Pseudomonadota bacterium]
MRSFFDKIFNRASKAASGPSDGAQKKGLGMTQGASDEPLEWHKVAEKSQLAEGRVTTVTAGRKTLALVHFDGQYAARPDADSDCPWPR